MKNGPVVFSTRTPASVANGSTSLFPGTATTYVLDAVNAAGDLVSLERTVNVSAPVQVSVSPQYPVPGQPVTVNWSLPQGDLLEVLGVPVQAPQTVPMSGNFVDLAALAPARILEFGNKDDDILALPTALAFRFPFDGSLRSRFLVSTNGFVALESADAMPDSSPIPLPSPQPMGARQWLPAMIAPLWADLEVGTGQVLYHVVGTEFPRQLVIQWEGVKLKEDGDSDLTFQVQLSESGEVRFIYKTLEPGTSATALQGARVGINGRGFATSLPSAASLADGVELRWFSSPHGQGSVELPLERSSRFAFFYRRQNGGLVTVSVPITLWGRDALALREAMPQPMAAEGTWAELVNTTGEQMRLDDAELHVASSEQTFSFPPGMVLEPGQTLVVGALDRPDENGGVTLGLELPGLAFAPADELTLWVGEMEISRLVWTASAVGESVERTQWVLDSARQTRACPRTAQFGTHNEKGTPGEPVEPCWSYRLEQIAYDPVDVLGSGTPLFINSVSNPRWRALPLDPPLPVFDRVYEEVQLGVNGYIAFEQHTTDNVAMSTHREPRITLPNAALVPYGTSFTWRSSPAATVRPDQAILYRRVEPGELGPGSPGQRVFAWNRMQHLSDSTASTSTQSDVSFQVRLFDDGVMEIHYGFMRNGSTWSSLNQTHTENHYGDGGAGPSWLENPSGTEALVINLATSGGLQPFTGYRFTPVQ